MIDKAELTDDKLMKKCLLVLNRGGILSDVEVDYYNRGAKAQLESAIPIIQADRDREIGERLERESSWWQGHKAVGFDSPKHRMLASDKYMELIKALKSGTWKGKK